MKAFFLQHAFLIATFFYLISCAYGPDKVTSLYGDLYSGEVYSGYLTTSSPGRMLHYVFLPSQGTPAVDPLVLWLNGGPGCSSLIGLIQEHGPVIVEDYSTQLTVNPYSWNTFANMLYIESPGGVGFSYTDTTDFNDALTAKDNLKAIQDFLKKYPEYVSNEFYISGESYAGIYVPTLAELIIKSGIVGINLKGILVGNGYTSDKYDFDLMVDFAYDHGLFSPETRHKYLQICPSYGNYPKRMITKECNQIRAEIKESLNGLNGFDVYRKCPPGKSPPDSYQNTIANFMKSRHAQKLQVDSSDLEELVEMFPDSCLDDPYSAQFLNKDETKDKMHVKKEITWTPCTEKIKYTTGESYNTYKNTLLSNLDKCRIWFYSGDTDGSVPFTGSRKWINSLGLEIVEEHRKWVVNGQTAGYVQVYAGGFSFITVKGAGHMVPQWKRKEALELFKNFFFIFFIFLLLLDRSIFNVHRFCEKV